MKTANDLLTINVNAHTEKKNGLTYLSWAWAWAQVLAVDPAATYEVKMFPHVDNPSLSLPFQDLGGSCMVWVTVTVFGKPLCVQLPVLDYRNKCIPTPNAFDVNTSIMRCLTKGIAMHGLGLYIYAGEDLPMEASEAPSIAVAPANTVSVKAVEPATEADTLSREQAEANANLFAEAMIEYLSIVKSEAQLKDYWKSNQGQLDDLKVHFPALYESIRTKFAEFKKQFTPIKD